VVVAVNLEIVGACVHGHPKICGPCISRRPSNLMDVARIVAVGGSGSDVDVDVDVDVSRRRS